MTHWIVAAFSVVVLVAQFLVDARGALAAYLAAFAFVASAALGALTLAMIGRLTEASWYRRDLRRATEALVATVPLLGLLFVPIGFGLSLLYPWAWYADPARGAWLDPRAFLLRSAAYLACWGILAILLPRSPRRTSLVGLPLIALTSSFASFDWLMSLEPGYASSIYGIYFWSGGFQAALALIVFQGPSTRASLGDTGVGGKLLLTASIFWVYVAYAQGLIIWIAGIPRETAWYAARTAGGWRWVLVALLVAKFVVPLFALLPYTWKRDRRVLVAASVSVLVGHLLDMEWLVAPAIHAAPRLDAVTVAAFAALASFVLGAAEAEREALLA